MMTVPTEQYIRHLERRLCNAMLGSDLAELDALLADDLVFTDHLGGLWGKQDDLDAHRSGMIKVKTVAVSEERIRLLDGIAIVNVRLEISGTFGSAEASGAFRFTRVWMPGQNGQWQVVTAHSTLIAGRDYVADDIA